MAKAKVTYLNLKTLRFANNSPHPDPSYEHGTDSGFDIRAWITDEEGHASTIVLKPLERALIHTGLYCEVPEYTEIQVRPRSGMALKRGLTVLNTPGTVDEGYRAEICVIAVNISNEDITIEDGERIAQCVICPVFRGSVIRMERVDEINKETDRGENGFGSTGRN